MEHCITQKQFNQKVIKSEIGLRNFKQKLFISDCLRASEIL
jgi:hypothetical protein